MRTTLIVILSVLLVVLAVMWALYLRERARLLRVLASGNRLVEAEDRGDTAAEEAAIGDIVAHGRGEPQSTNLAVNALVHRGRYAEALRLEAHLPTSRLLLRVAAQRAHFVDLELLVQVNLAEAEYNLGRWDAALARLDRLALRHADMAPLTRAGLAQQRAWVLAHLGRHDDAASVVASARREDLPKSYHAEWHYTRGVIDLLGGSPAAADAGFVAGLACAVRPASERNGLFLRARARAALGDEAEALALFARAAEHPYRHQGGDGLLAWGDLLVNARHGRSAPQRALVGEARDAWQLACERDPESESAAIARQRLAALPT